jgi:hypothetical protein
MIVPSMACVVVVSKVASDAAGLGERDLSTWRPR